MNQNLKYYIYISGKTNYRSVPNIQILRDHLIREGHINKPEVIDILKEARYIFGMFLIFYFQFLKNI